MLHRELVEYRAGLCLYRALHLKVVKWWVHVAALVLALECVPFWCLAVVPYCTL